MYELLTNENFLLYCAKYYNNRYLSSTEDLFNDLKRIKYIRKLITRFQQSGDLKYRLILNHIIILNNVFGPTLTCRILFLKLHDQFKFIKPFLLLLNILPETLYNVGKINIIDTNCIEMDSRVIEALRTI